MTPEERAALITEAETRLTMQASEFTAQVLDGGRGYSLRLSFPAEPKLTLLTLPKGAFVVVGAEMLAGLIALAKRAEEWPNPEPMDLISGGDA